MKRLLSPLLEKERQKRSALERQWKKNQDIEEARLSELHRRHRETVSKWAAEAHAPRDDGAAANLKAPDSKPSAIVPQSPTTAATLSVCMAGTSGSGARLLLRLRRLILLLLAQCEVSEEQKV